MASYMNNAVKYEEQEGESSITEINGELLENDEDGVGGGDADSDGDDDGDAGGDDDSDADGDDYSDDDGDTEGDDDVDGNGNDDSEPPEESDDESESDYEWNATKDQPRTESTFNEKFCARIAHILETHSEPNCTNALVLNREMVTQLLDMREVLHVLLQRVRERYKKNEEQLAHNMKRNNGYGIRGAYLKGGTFYLKGNMFFKDSNCRNCPNNADYVQRSNEGELFPMDLELRSRHVWSLHDKASIVKAIKEQVIDHMSHFSAQKRIKKQNWEVQKQISLHSSKLVDLLAEVGDDFQIDWQQISVHNMRYRHTATSCKAMWRCYLHPSLKRSAWTDEENRCLLDAARAHHCQNWDAIARAVGQRSDYQCFIQYRTRVFYMQPERWLKWNKADDKRLLGVIEQCTMNGIINWNMVMTQFPNKPKNTIQARYTDRLSPHISHAPFTAEEDLVLLSAVKEYGDRFSCFPRTLFPHRSLTQLRSRYRNTLKQRDNLKPWSIEDDKKLMAFIAEHGTSAWLSCSQTLGNHTRISCRTRYLTIEKFFAKNPGATFEDLPRKKVRAMDNTITPQNWLGKVWELRENPNADFKQPKLEKPKETIPKRAKAAIKPKDTKILQRKQNEKRKPAKALSSHDCSLGTVAEPEQQAAAVVSSPPRSHNKPMYIERLRTNELKMYHFFKYAYNYQPATDVCPKIPGVRALSQVAIALQFNPPANAIQRLDNIFSLRIRRKFATWLNDMQPAVKANCGNFLLPPSWSTAVGFRALCVLSAQVSASAEQVRRNVQSAQVSASAEQVRQDVQSAQVSASAEQVRQDVQSAQVSASAEQVRQDVQSAQVSASAEQVRQDVPSAQVSASAEQVRQDVQTHAAVQLFRARLRSLFFRTTLLSRLNPASTGNVNFLTEAPESDSANTQTPYAKEETEATEEINVAASTSSLVECKRELYLAAATDSVDAQVNEVATSPSDHRVLALQQLEVLDANKRKRKLAQAAVPKSQNKVAKRSPEDTVCIKSESKL